MDALNLDIRLEQLSDEPCLSALSAEAFGPGRFARSAYRIREGIVPIASLCLTAWREHALVGGIRFTSIAVGGKEGGLLLGPLVVDPAHSGQGIGRALIAAGLEGAKSQGFGFVLLVGDMPYYGRFGFVPVPRGQITLPGPVDPARVLALEITLGTLAEMKGSVKGRPPVA
ncbi:MAG TPA: N-acetyltransferase [Methyloceanibacter sp.]|jgi:predicted N-acetyltransferase YhbS